MTEALTELQDEVTDLRVSLARAESERDAARDMVAELRATLADLRRPWWRRRVER